MSVIILLLLFSSRIVCFFVCCGRTTTTSYIIKKYNTHMLGMFEENLVRENNKCEINVLKKIHTHTHTKKLLIVTSRYQGVMSFVEFFIIYDNFSDVTSLFFCQSFIDRNFCYLYQTISKHFPFPTLSQLSTPMVMFIQTHYNFI